MRLLLDTNVLLLYLIGHTAKRYIGMHKATDIFEEQDFDLLNTLLEEVLGGNIITIPHVLTETSNLLAKGHKNHTMRIEIWNEIRKFIEFTQEFSSASAEIVTDPSFLRLGITDAFLAMLSDDECIVISTDAKLCHEIAGRGRRVINFNHEIGRHIF